MERHPDPAAHWDGAYSLGEHSRSWFQPHPELSLQMLDAAGVPAGDSLIDVGGGASPLAGALVGRGFKDVTVLDISATGMQYAQWRLGEKASQVQWIAADVLAWQPERRYQTWHDRAVFHFLTSGQDRHQYKHTLHAATTAGAVAIFGCFAPGGPSTVQGCRSAATPPMTLPGSWGRSGPRWPRPARNTRLPMPSSSPSPGQRSADKHDRSISERHTIRGRSGLQEGRRAMNA
jgi:hypothetical protein